MPENLQNRQNINIVLNGKGVSLSLRSAVRYRDGHYDVFAWHRDQSIGHICLSDSLKRSGRVTKLEIGTAKSMEATFTEKFAVVAFYRAE